MTHVEKVEAAIRKYDALPPASDLLDQRLQLPKAFDL
jgi:hypothetical protein